MDQSGGSWFSEKASNQMLSPNWLSHHALLELCCWILGGTTLHVAARTTMKSQAHRYIRTNSVGGLIRIKGNVAKRTESGGCYSHKQFTNGGRTRNFKVEQPNRKILLDLNNVCDTCWKSETSTGSELTSSSSLFYYRAPTYSDIATLGALLPRKDKTLFPSFRASVRGLADAKRLSKTGLTKGGASGKDDDVLGSIIGIGVHGRKLNDNAIGLEQNGGAQGLEECGNAMGFRALHVGSSEDKMSAGGSRLATSILGNALRTDAEAERDGGNASNVQCAGSASDMLDDVIP
ncbi:unnamed protein product [Ilex paraguariensis]|uniref:Uncharacterized protein n=1 Tax=Ilex paraguariensis TaxID=185542 RepID=A0ABC8UFI4_9AQUA